MDVTCVFSCALWCQYESVCLYHWCFLTDLLPWHREAGQGYGCELLIDCFSNSVNEIEMGLALHSACESHKTPFFCFWAHCVSRFVVCSFNSGETLHAKCVGPIAIRRNYFRAGCEGYLWSPWSSHIHSWWGVEKVGVASCHRGDPCNWYAIWHEWAYTGGIVLWLGWNRFRSSEAMVMMCWKMLATGVNRFDSLND